MASLFILCLPSCTLPVGLVWRCQAWVDACKNPKLFGVPAEWLYKTGRICCQHFNDWCFMNVNLKHRLVHNAIPDAPKPHYKVNKQRKSPTKESIKYTTANPIIEKSSCVHNAIQDAPDPHYNLDQQDKCPTKEPTKYTSTSNPIVEISPCVYNSNPDAPELCYNVDKQDKCPTKASTKCTTTFNHIVVRFPRVHNAIPDAPDFCYEVDKQDKCQMSSAKFTGIANPLFERSPCLLAHLLQSPNSSQHTSVKNAPIHSKSLTEISTPSPSSFANPLFERSPFLLSHLLQSPNSSQHTSFKNAPIYSKSLTEISTPSPSSSESFATLDSVFNDSSSLHETETTELLQVVQHCIEKCSLPQRKFSTSRISKKIKHTDYHKKLRARFSSYKKIENNEKLSLKQNSECSSLDNQMEATEQELVSVKLRDAENQDRMQDLLHRINELETINKRLKETYTENAIINIQKELTAVKLREAEAQQYNKELLQKINNLQSQLMLNENKLKTY